MSFVFSAGMILASCLTVFASEIKLNPETLDRVKNLDDMNDWHVKADELFIGLEKNGFTLKEIEDNIKNYNIEITRDSSERANGFDMGGILFFGVDVNYIDMEAAYMIAEPESLANFDYSRSHAEEEWEERMQNDEEWIKYQKQFSDVIYNELIPLEATCEVAFHCGYQEAEAMIEKIEYINNGGGIARTAKKNGWLFEDGAWRYYENDVRVVNGWKNIDDKWYYFKDDASMVHSCLFEVDGKIYSFSTEGAIDYGWQERNPGDGNHWYYFDMESDSKGAALTGRKDGIGFDSYKYFFWTDGYTDQNGIGHAKGSLAIGSDASDQWILKDGTPLYVADKDGHLYTNTEKKLNGAEYTIDENGNVLPKLVKPYRYTDKNHTGPYADYVVVSGFDSKFVTTQTGDTNCTATCDFLVGKITGQLSPDTSYKQVESEIWSGLALWKYCDRTVTGSNGWEKILTEN